MLIGSIGNNYPLAAGGIPIQSLGTIVITMLALNAIQGVPKAEAGFWAAVGGVAGSAADKAMVVMGWAGSLFTSKEAGGVADAISKYATFKQVADKVCDAGFLLTPQFVIPFRVGMTVATLGMEIYADVVSMIISATITTGLSEGGTDALPAS